LVRLALLRLPWLTRSLTRLPLARLFRLSWLAPLPRLTWLAGLARLARLARLAGRLIGRIALTPALRRTGRWLVAHDVPRFHSEGAPIRYGGAIRE
jgi:hypothetical protein